jgi:hypothetical protein
MRARTVAPIIGLCSLCAISRSDVLGPADLFSAATVQAAPIDPSKDPVYICPMDPDVRSHQPGKCRRCGMALVSGIPDPVEFHLDVSTLPEPVRAGHPAALQFFVHDPWKDRPVSDYNLVHERLFHAFVVSEDLQFFQHSHPTLVANGIFQLPITFPHAGMFRVLGDFYPSGATPQLNAQTIVVPGNAPPPVTLTTTTHPSRARTCACRSKRSRPRRLPATARSCDSASSRETVWRSISARGRTCLQRATISSI